MSTRRRPGRWVPALVIAVLAGTYGYRAVVGGLGGLAFAQASSLKGQGSRDRAQEKWRRGAVGGERLRALREAGEATAGLWDRRFANEGSSLMNDTHLETAIRDYMAALQISPASGTNWSGLARIYDRKERVLRGRRPESGDPGEAGPSGWNGVGRSGRIAIGLMRRATESEPAWYVHHDNLAIMFIRYGLKDEALDAVRESAEALPIFARHSYRLLNEFPDELMAAFIEGSRAGIGNTPLLERTSHLISLARLERRAGLWDESVTTLELALQGPLDRSDRAEIHYNLGMGLIRLERLEEAEENLNASVEHPRFRSSSLVSLSRIADERGDRELALDLLRQARRERPNDLYLSLGFARLALEVGDLPAAFEAANWAALTHPRDPRTHELLFDAHLAAGHWEKARDLLRHLESRDIAVNRSRMRRALLEAHPDSERR